MMVVWLMMTLSGLLFVEIGLWLPPGAHVITMAQRMLGPWGKAVAWVLYLFISYASIVAYAAGVGDQVAGILAATVGAQVSSEIGSLLFILVFTAAIFWGRHAVGTINTVLFLALVGAYLMLLSMGLGEVELANLTHQRWQGVGFTVPLLLTAFSYHAIVPSMIPYLNRHRGALRGAIVGGTSLSFLIYLAWQVLVLGSVPFAGEFGLREAFVKGVPATQFLAHSVGSPYVARLAEYFAFFALVTSYLGMTLGLYDFLSDGLGIKERGLGKLFLGALIILPTYYFATQFARVFLIALDTSGGFGDAILNGIMPVMMVWIGRYVRQYEAVPLVPGGRLTLVAIVLFYLCALGLEIGSQLGCLTLEAAL
jgi:tyrosine-specific transport protein